MKYSLSTLLVLFSVVFVFAQTEDDPVVWLHEVVTLSDEEIELVFKGEILEGWYVYSQNTAEGGALPSEFTFNGAGEDYELLGKTEEGKTITAFSEIFEVDETFFKKEALFRQKVRLLKPGLPQINVNLFYQVCKEVCISKEVDFYVALNGSEVIVENKIVDERSTALSGALKLDLKQKELLTGGKWIQS